MHKLQGGATSAERVCGVLRRTIHPRSQRAGRKALAQMPKDACQHVVYKASGALLSGHPARRCCGHHCPVCGGHAWALTRCCKDSTCNAEADVPWRWELDRVAHKCYGKQHRFDVERSTGRSLSDFMYMDRDSVTHTVPAGTKAACLVIRDMPRTLGQDAGLLLC